MNNIGKRKIALVRQEIYQDLYVCPKEEKDTATILFSSQMRVGPIGLISELNADFIIVKEEYDRETQIYRKVIPHIADYLQILKTGTVDKMPGGSMFVPGSSHASGEYAVSCSDIDWSVYEIVISINISIPIRILKQYPKTLFCYMIGEANFLTKSHFFGYDITLNQKARGTISHRSVIDFPYTFLKGNSLEKIILQYVDRPSKKQGVFMEINSTMERPVTKAPKHFEILVNKGYTINLHKQNIKENLLALYDSKYFIKMGGRKIRGNSVVEAISAGVLVMMNRKEIIYTDLIIDECNVETMEDVLEKINFIDNNPDKYTRLLNKQRKIVDELFFEAPIKSLIRCWHYKQQKHRNTYSYLDKLKDKIVFIYIDFFNVAKKVKKKLFI